MKIQDMQTKEKAAISKEKEWEFQNKEIAILHHKIENLEHSLKVKQIAAEKFELTDIKIRKLHLHVVTLESLVMQKTLTIITLRMKLKECGDV